MSYTKIKCSITQSGNTNEFHSCLFQGYIIFYHSEVNNNKNLRTVSHFFILKKIQNN